MKKEENNIPRSGSNESDDLLKSFFHSFTKKLITELKSELEWLELNPGDILFEEGDDGDEVFIVLEGNLVAKIKEKSGAELILGHIGARECVGEMALLTGEYRSATVEAIDKSVLVKLSRDSFLSLSERMPIIQQFFSAIISTRLRKNRLNFILPSFLGSVDHSVVDEFVREVEWVEMVGGEILFLQGDPSDSVYFVISGHLSAWLNMGTENQRKIGEIIKGECIGEMGLLTGEERGATVIANRDCVLAKLSQEFFYKISSKFPQLLLNLSRIIIGRLKKSQTKGFHESTVSNIAVVFTSSNIDRAGFRDQFMRAIQAIDIAFSMDSESIGAQLGIADIAQIAPNDNQCSRLSIMLEERELTHKYCIYFADLEANNWTQRCIRQADHLILVGNATDSPKLGSIEEDIKCVLESQKFLKKTLVLIHPQDTKIPSGTKEWLSRRDLSDHIHIRHNLQRDYERLARILTGNAIAVVYGGGGAKGMTHIGVTKALKEANIPIDLVAGASIGAVLASMIAMDLDVETLEQLACDFIKAKPFNDYTVPFVSLLRGKRIKNAFSENLDYSLEDLWLNCFCVSTDISNNNIEIHRHGPLLDALMASVALPAIFPPVIKESRLLVDGGVMNNLPGDIMRDLYDCKLITVDLGGETEMIVERLSFPKAAHQLRDRLIPGRKTEYYPGLMEILVRSITVGSSRLSKQVKEMADLSLELPVSKYNTVNLKRMKESLKIGYHFTKKQLAELENIDFFRRVGR
jgi:NTE family protein/lysophospholipid hydrolase